MIFSASFDLLCIKMLHTRLQQSLLCKTGIRDFYPRISHKARIEVNLFCLNYYFKIYQNKGLFFSLILYDNFLRHSTYYVSEHLTRVYSNHFYAWVLSMMKTSVNLYISSLEKINEYNAILFTNVLIYKTANKYLFLWNKQHNIILKIKYIRIYSFYIFENLWMEWL